MKISSSARRLRVGAVEDRHLRVVDAAAAQRLDLVGDELRLVVLRVAGEADDLLARADVGPQLLVFAVEVVADDRVRRAQDVLRRPVVLLEQHDLARRGSRVSNSRDVADVGAAERVDRLVGVADDGEGCRSLRGSSAGSASKIIMPFDANPARRPSRPAASARGSGRTGRGWCPGTRRPGCGGTGAGRCRRRAGTRGRDRPSDRSGRRSRRRSPAAARAGSRVNTSTNTRSAGSVMFADRA